MEWKRIDPRAGAIDLFEGFKAFAFKGNVVDLAVGVIIGGAFGNIVKSLVDNILMPLIGLILPGDRGYAGWVANVGGKTVPYGRFIGDVVNFLILAMALYLFLVKFVGLLAASKKKEESAAPPTKQEELLAEIRDLLRRQGTPDADR